LKVVLCLLAVNNLLESSIVETALQAIMHTVDKQGTSVAISRSLI